MGLAQKAFVFTQKLKNNENFRNGIIFAFFSFLNNGINFLITMLLAVLLTQEDFGNLNLFNTMQMIITIIIPLGTTSYISASYFKVSRVNFNQILSCVYTISTTTFCTLFILFCLIGNSTELLVGISLKFQLITLLICFFQQFYVTNLEIWRLQEQPVKYGVYTTILVVCNVILTLLLVYVSKLGWEGRVYAMLITNFIFFIISLTLLYKRGFITFSRTNSIILKSTLAFGIPLIPHMITAWIRQGLDRYIINLYWDVSFVAIFSFALNLSNIINMIGIAFNASNSVFIYKNLKNIDDTTKRKLLKQTIFMSIFFLSLSLIVFISSHMFIPYLLPKYTDALPYLLPLCIAAFFQCIYYLFVNYLFYFEKTKTLMLITFSISIFHMLLSFYFTKISITYTAYITLISNFAICILVIFFSQKQFRLK